jgi:hypothetical protein
MVKKKKARTSHSSHPKKNVEHHALTDFYTAQQKREMESEKQDAAMFEHLKKLRKSVR